MKDELYNDVNLRVLGTGCASSCGLGCVTGAFLLLIAFNIGTRAITTSPFFSIFGFLVGSLTCVVLGYIVARAALSRGAAVNFHIILFGIIQMLIGVFAWMLPQSKVQFSNDVAALLLIFRVLGWLLIIPLMLLGASWAKKEKHDSS